MALHGKSFEAGMIVSVILRRVAVKPLVAWLTPGDVYDAEPRGIHFSPISQKLTTSVVIHGTR